MQESPFNHNALPFADHSHMPAVFIGHGSPMNAIETNKFTENWAKLGALIPNPKAIVCISAHWLTKGTFITVNENPETIHDFYGCPDLLYQIIYPAPGNPDLYNLLNVNIVQPPTIQKTYDWGLDHGTWSVLRHMYPNANIPTIQLSIDYTKSLSWHFRMGQAISFLRHNGILVIGSGNLIHNLRLMHIPDDDSNATYGCDWAIEFNNFLKEKIRLNDVQELQQIQHIRTSSLAIPTPEHYIPFLYIMGTQQPMDAIQIFNDNIIAGSLSMTSVLLG